MRHLNRRLEQRYRFEQPLRYVFEQRGAAQLRAGTTTEVGAGGVLFQTDCPPPDGVRVELRMTWPILVQGVCSVVLVINGTVVRTDGRGTSVRIDQYLFETMESCALESASNSAVGCNLIG